MRAVSSPVIFAPAVARKKHGRLELGCNTSAMSGHLVLASGDAGRARSCPPSCGAGERPKLSICGKSFGLRDGRPCGLLPSRRLACRVSPSSRWRRLAPTTLACLLALMGARLASSISCPCLLISLLPSTYVFWRPTLRGPGVSARGLPCLLLTGSL